MFFLFCLKIDLKIVFCRNQTPPTTPERVRTAAQQNERIQRVLDSPENRRIPSGRYSHLPVDLAQQLAALQPLHNFQSDSTVASTSRPMGNYQHLPANLAQQLAALPPMPSRGRGGYRGRSNQPLPLPPPLLQPPPLLPPALLPPPPPRPLEFNELIAQYNALPPLVPRPIVSLFF